MEECVLNVRSIEGRLIEAIQGNDDGYLEEERTAFGFYRSKERLELANF